MTNLKKYRKYLFLLLPVIVLMFLQLVDNRFNMLLFLYVAAFFGLALGAILLYGGRAIVRSFSSESRVVAKQSKKDIHKVSVNDLDEMPMGVLLFDKDNKIQWVNAYMMNIFPKKSWENLSVADLSPLLPPLLKDEKQATTIGVNNRNYKVTIQHKANVLYFFDVTEQTKISRLYHRQQTVIALIHLDNYDEIATGLNDQSRFKLSSLVTYILNDWAEEQRILIKKASADVFLAVLDKGILATLEENKFSILDTVREETAKAKVSITLSIGVGVGNLSLPELSELAQSGLDLALGRGGDQVAIKNNQGKVSFYGGKTNPIEKRTRVRARVISHALQDVISDSSSIFIVGHKSPDLDVIGASVGILKMVTLCKRPGYIVLDVADLNKGVGQLVGELQEKPQLGSHFISREKAMELIDENSLIVVVDTHKPSMVIEEQLLHKSEKVVVIDHHRKGEEFIKNPMLVYIEPYASSAAELVTELLEYHREKFKLSTLEATALLAGIVVDTKNFTFRTGSRTFDAAAFLRTQGGDTVFVQKLLREDRENYLARAGIIEHAYFYKEGIAISVSTEILPQVLIAQTADTLLSMSTVVAAFVIAKKEENVVGISARSLGDMNVQLIMEKLGGGGHLVNAATQLKDITIEEAEKKLHASIDEQLANL